MALFKLDQNKKYNTNKPKVGHQQHIVSPDNESINSTQTDPGYTTKGDSDFFNLAYYILNDKKLSLQNSVYSLGNYFSPSQFNPMFLPVNFFSVFVQRLLDYRIQEYLDTYEYSEFTISDIKESIKQQELLAISEEDSNNIENLVLVELQKFDELFQ